MVFNITIDHETTRDNSSRSPSSGSEDDSSDTVDTGVHLSEGQEYDEPHEEQEDWEDVLGHSYNEVGPSDSASRQPPSSRTGPIVEAPQPEEHRRTSYRRRHSHHERSRNVPPPRKHHRSPPSTTEVESVDPHEEWQGDARGLPHHRQYPQYAAGYASQYQQMPSHSVVPVGHQQMVPYGYQQYQVAPSSGPPSFFAPGHHMASPGGAPYGHPGGGYFPYQHSSGYPMHHPMPPPMPQPMPPQHIYHSYPVYTPPPQAPAPAPAPAPPPAAPTPAPASPAPPPDTSKKDEEIARLEKLFIDHRDALAAKEAAAEKAAADKAAKAAADAEKAAEIKAAAEAAAKEAREKSNEEHKAAAEKAAKEAEEAAEKAAKEAAEAAAAAKAAQPPKEKPKPLKFKDAVGRKFQFPFHLCNTWTGMERLIREAFAHVEVIGPHVEQGHFDLLGPQGEIILPHVWDTVVEPDWTITMHMWPMSEEAEPEPPPAGDVIDIATDPEPEKKSKKKQKPPPLFPPWGKRKSAKGKKK